MIMPGSRPDVASRWATSSRGFRQSASRNRKAQHEFLNLEAWSVGKPQRREARSPAVFFCSDPRRLCPMAEERGRISPPRPPEHYAND